MPRRIECCDISHLGGQDTVGAIVGMTDGAPDKKRYRTFHVRGEAARVHNRRSADYLLGMPLLADHLEEALSQFGHSCEDYEMGRL